VGSIARSVHLGIVGITAQIVEASTGMVVVHVLVPGAVVVPITLTPGAWFVPWLALPALRRRLHGRAAWFGSMCGLLG
jgi:hypothetical protein